LPPHAGGRTP